MADKASSVQSSPSIFEPENSPWDDQSLTDSVVSISSVESDIPVAENDVQGENTIIDTDVSPTGSPIGSPLPTPLMFSDRDPLATNPNASITHPTLPPPTPGISDVSAVNSSPLPPPSRKEGKSNKDEKPATSWFELRGQMELASKNGDPTGREEMLMGAHLWQVMNAIESTAGVQTPQIKREDSGGLGDPLNHDVDGR